MNYTIKRISSPVYLLVLILFISLSSGCSLMKEWLPEQIDETKAWSASKLYAEAKANLSSGDYKTAIGLYEKLEARFPHSKYALQAQLETAYAYYRFEEPENAIAETERFIKTHPKHPNVDYAYYLRGLVVFPGRKNVFEFVWPQDESQRDSRSSLESFEYFKELVLRFPDSRYAKDSVLRMRYLRNKIAKNEIHVANFYYKQGAYLASANRGAYVVQNFPKTPAVKEALALMAKSYDKLGLPELAEDARKIYAINEPNFYEDVFLPEESVVPYMPEWMKP